MYSAAGQQGLEYKKEAPIDTKSTIKCKVKSKFSKFFAFS